MAATTTLLGLVTPTQGTLSGTWGDTVNYGISDYLDIAIAGTLSFAGDGAITLANTTGSASGNAITTTTAQYMVIRITGTQTVTKVITGPSYSKLYMVDHAGATSAVTFKAAGQSGVSVAVGEKCFVYYNGTDYVKVATSTGTGSVTSVGFTGGIVTVATQTTTPAFTIAGTSGGVPYFTSASAWASSGALTQYGVVYGGGAGAAPVATANGTTGQAFIATTSGAPSWGTLGPAGGGTGVSNNAAMTVTGAGNFAYTRTLTGATNVTFPTTGTLATLAGAETLTNKTLTSPTMTAPVLGTIASGDGTALTGVAKLTTNTFTGAQIGSVTALTSSSASVAINLATNCNFSYTTVENSTLAAPSNPVAGQSGSIVITQGATARTLAYNTFYKFPGGTVPTLTATASAVDTFVYYVESATRATCQLIKDVK